MVAKGTAPSSRGGHSGIFAYGVENSIIIFGGSEKLEGVLVDSETYKLKEPWNPSSQWEKLTTTGTAPSARAEHTAVYEGGLKPMIVFGGYTEGVKASSETYTLDFSFTPVSWTKLNATGEIPARYGHSAVWGGMGMMVFGGKDNPESLLNDCWELNLETKQWTPIYVTGDKPSARWQHTAVWMWGEGPGEMIILGGEDENGNHLDDVWVLYTPGPGEPGYRWERIYPIGDSPSGRAGHAAALGWGGEGGEKMFIFGGADEKGDLNDVYAFSRGEKVKETLEEKPFNAPNPFNPYEGETKICYYLDRDDDNVTIKLFTLTGDLVYSWENISGREGLNQWPWDGRNEKGKIVENGGYICLIEGAGKKQKCKIAVLK